jgi:hypothetical protein
MRFFTIFTVLAAGVMAFAGAVPEIVEKRSTTDVQNAFTTLNNQCDTILPKFGGCSDNDCTLSIVLELVAAINTCKNTLGGVTGGIATPGLASVVAGVVIVSGSELSGYRATHISSQKITNALKGHKDQCGSGCPNVNSIYAQVDVALSLCLGVAFNLCLGLVVLVGVL